MLVSEVFYGLWNVINFDYGLHNNNSHQRTYVASIRLSIINYAIITDTPVSYVHMYVCMSRRARDTYSVL